MLKIKSLLISVFFFVALAASAQLSFGVKAGLNLSTISKTDDSKMKIGYKVGPMAEFGLGNMAVQGALLLSSKGVKSDYGDEDVTVNANYLELPITFVYKYPLAFDTNLYANAGPYFAYGIFGKTGTDDYDVDTFGDDDDSFGMKKFDMGLTFGIGMEVTKFNFGLNYDLGLTKVADYDDAGKNGNFWISVGYKF